MMQWRATVNDLSWERIPNASWSVEAYGRRASIVRLADGEALCTLQASGEDAIRWSFGPEQMDNTKARIKRFLGAAED